MSRAALRHRDDLPDAADLAQIEADQRAATVDPHQGPRPCTPHLTPGQLCSTCWTDHTCSQEAAA